MEKPWIVENDAERTRLGMLVARLSDSELATPMPAGWTIAGVLAHCAFWDARALCLIDKWERGIPPSADDREQGDADIYNDASKPLCLALPPRTAANLALQLAEETDSRVAAMSDTLIGQMESVGGIFNLARAWHRAEHLDEIEAALEALGK